MMTFLRVTFFNLALLFAAAPVLAQTAIVEAAAPAAPPVPEAQFALYSADGKTSQTYGVGDVSTSISWSLSYDRTLVDVSMSLSSIHPMDTFLLDWVKEQGDAPESARRASFTIPAAASQPGSQELVYAIDGARVGGFSSSYSVSSGINYLSMQLSARQVSINGSKMK